MLQQRRWCIAILVLSALMLMAHGATIKIDQSQTGDYNLQIHLKNIELYAVFDDSSGSDDEYGDLPDYTDPIETSSKPLSSSTSTTNAPSSSTDAVSTTSAAPLSPLLDPYSQTNSDKIVQMVEALIASNGNASDPPTEPSAVTAASTPSTTIPPPPPPTTTQPSSASAPSTNNSGNGNRKCGPGYFRDPMGRCRRIRKPHLPFLQMVHTPGVIKSFQPQQRMVAEEENTSKN